MHQGQRFNNTERYFRLLYMILFSQGMFRRPVPGRFLLQGFRRPCNGDQIRHRPSLHTGSTWLGVWA